MSQSGDGAVSKEAEASDSIESSSASYSCHFQKLPLSKTKIKMGGAFAFKFLSALLFCK